MIRKPGHIITAQIDTMPELIPVLNKDTIARTVAAIAQQISSDYQGTELVLIGVLKGAFIFMADLARLLTLEHVQVDFVQLASYGNDQQSSGQITVLKDVSTDIEGKDVLVVEDILDTGLTVSFLIKHLEAKNPRSVKTCFLIDKQERRQVEIKADYVGHQTDAGFLVGYGLDFAEIYRNLPGIYHLKN